MLDLFQIIIIIIFIIFLYCVFKISFDDYLDEADVIIDYIFIPNDIPINIHNNINEYNGLNADVHDHAIQRSVQTAFNKLNKWYNNHRNLQISESESINQIKDYIFKGFKGKREIAERAYNTIRTMQKLNGYLVSLKAHEIKILSVVWSRIKDPLNADVQDEIANNLVELLSDSTINLDNAYCLTGRVTRIIQSLESIDAEDIVNIISSDSIHLELKNKVPNLRDQYLSSHSMLKAYEQGDENVEDNVKQYVKQQLTVDYLDSKLLTPHAFDKIVTPYLNQL